MLVTEDKSVDEIGYNERPSQWNGANKEEEGEKEGDGGRVP